jgi:hypothetical protein
MVPVREYLEYYIHIDAAVFPELLKTIGRFLSKMMTSKPPSEAIIYKTGSQKPTYCMTKSNVHNRNDLPLKFQEVLCPKP